MDVSYSSNRYIEFNHKGVNKGAGLKKLADLLRIDIQDTIAIGDNYNDLSMIKDAGLGVGVKMLHLVLNQIVTISQRLLVKKVLFVKLLKNLY